ncbi:MAG: tRNA (adenosine(37)-N6)-threonylcarbamoyltransferase complex dimerization subunit type 1 TsaB [Ignavibacteriales bacterium]|nr:MAG: tRNA (adenosine(37)-N6)-threonylcarbamoyltransferase complex dimerization subunit type 1 TsaB [Ignavibacteriales bacterium]
MNTKKPVLAIETSAKLCGVSVYFDSQRYFTMHRLEERSHARKLAGMIQYALESQLITSSDLAFVAVSGGPGSFTGLRIGFSVAKGLCLGAGIPLKRVNTIEAIAFESLDFIENEETFTVALKVNRNEVFFRRFQKKGDFYKFAGDLLTIENSRVTDLTQKGELIICNFELEERRFLRREYPSPQKIAELALLSDVEAEEEIDFLEPEYVKDFQIVRKDK